MCRLFTIFFVFVFAVQSALAVAKPAGAIFEINKGVGAGATQQNEPKIARLGDTALVVWTDNAGVIFGTLINSKGKAITQILTINDTSAKPFSQIAVSEHDYGFLVAWVDQRNAGTSGEDIYGCFVSSTGDVMPDFQITGAPGDQSLPSIGWNGRNLLVTWAQFENNTGSICGRRLTTEGGLLDGAVGDVATLATPGITQSVFTSSTASNGDSWAVVWSDSGGVGLNVYGIQVKADGTSPQSSGRGLPLGPMDHSPHAPDIAWDGERYMLVFFGLNPAFNHIYGQLLQSDLTLDGSLIGITSGTDADTYPEVAAKGGDFFVMWSSNTPPAFPAVGPGVTRLKGSLVSGSTIGTPLVLMEHSRLPSTGAYGDVVAFYDRWLPVAGVWRTFNAFRACGRFVSGGRFEQPLYITPLGDKNMGDAAFDLFAEGDTGLALSFQSLVPSVATIANGRVTLVGAGEAVIRVSIAGNTVFGPSSGVVRFNVGLSRQTVSIPALVQAYPGTDVTLTATSSSGLTPVYEIYTGSGEIVDGGGGAKLLRITGVGPVLVHVTIAGNANFAGYDEVITVGADSVRPTVVITGPAGPLASATATVTGRAADDNVVAAVQVKINSDPWVSATVTRTGAFATWTVNIPAFSGFKPGTNRIVARAIDLAGNTSDSATAEVQVSATGSAPTLVPFSPAANASLSGLAAANFVGGASNLDPNQRTSFRLNGGAWFAASGTTSWAAQLLPLHGLKKGTNILELRTEHPAGTRSAILAIPFKFTPAPADDFTAPTVAITGPAQASASFNATYTAADNVAIASVEHRINGGDWQISGGNIPVVHDGAPLLLEMRAKDANGNVSKIASRHFTRAGTGGVNVKIFTDGFETMFGGGGTVTPSGPVSAPLGKTVTFVAKASPGYAFLGWKAGSIEYKAAKITFPLPTSVDLQAHFVYERRTSHKRDFVGLALRADNDPVAAGYISITAAKLGAFTGKLLWSGVSYPLKGAFDVFGEWTATLVTKQNTTLVVRLRLQAYDETITGSVDDSVQIATITAPETDFYSYKLFNPWDGAYTIAIPSPDSGVLSNGSATVAIAGNGTLTIKGTLADGTKISLATTLAADTAIAAGIPLPKAKGQFLLRLVLDSVSGSRSLQGPAFFSYPSAVSGMKTVTGTEVP